MSGEEGPIYNRTSTDPHPQRKTGSLPPTEQELEGFLMGLCTACTVWSPPVQVHHTQGYMQWAGIDLQTGIDLSSDFGGGERITLFLHRDPQYPASLYILNTGENFLKNPGVSGQNSIDLNGTASAYTRGEDGPKCIMVISERMHCSPTKHTQISLLQIALFI